VEGAVVMMRYDPGGERDSRPREGKCFLRGLVCFARDVGRESLIVGETRGGRLYAAAGRCLTEKKSYGKEDTAIEA